LFTTSLNSAVVPFMIIAVDKQDPVEANRIFNTFFWSTAAILIILLGPMLYLSLQAHLFFNVPVGYEEQFVVLFLCSLGIYFLTTLSSSFGIATYCLNRFDLSNMVNTVGLFARVAAILMLFNLYVPKVWHVGLAMSISAVVGLVLSVIIWRQLLPKLKVERSFFSGPVFAKLTSMVGWMLINHIGVLLFLSIDLVVVNKLLGAEAGGKYGALILWSVMLRSLACVTGGVFRPPIASFYGRQDMPGLIAYTRRAIKFVGLMIALPIGLICGFAQPLLRIWLGPVFEPLAPLMILMCLHLSVNLMVLPLIDLQVASNHVRLPGILTFFMGIGNLGLALLLAGPVGWGMYGVAAAGAIVMSAKNVVFTPLYGAQMLGVEYRTFYREIFPVIGITLVSSVAGWWLAQNLQINTWLALGLAGLCVGGVFALVTYHLFLTKEERLYALSLVLGARTSTP